MLRTIDDSNDRAEQGLLHTCVEELKQSVNVVKVPNSEAEEEEFRNAVEGKSPTPLGEKVAGKAATDQTGLHNDESNAKEDTESTAAYVMQYCTIQ